jgi:inorganic pyrophosphatase
MRFDDVPPCEPEGDRVHVVIDTPAGSRNKYKFDEKLGIFRLSRVLPAGLVFPHDFGSVPGTRAADGDPLDVLVLGLPPTFPGCLITVRLIGVLHARQVEHGKSIRNDRLIGVGETPVNVSPVRALEDIELEGIDGISRRGAFGFAIKRSTPASSRTPNSCANLIDCRKRTERRWAVSWGNCTLNSTANLPVRYDKRFRPRVSLKPARYPPGAECDRSSRHRATPASRRQRQSTRFRSGARGRGRTSAALFETPCPRPPKPARR